MGDWLGTGTVAPRLRQHRSFEDDRDLLADLISAVAPNGAPSARETFLTEEPAPKTYPLLLIKPTRKRVGANWLETGTIAPVKGDIAHLRMRVLLPVASEFKVKANGCDFCLRQIPTKGVRPSDIPACPNMTYKRSGWPSWGDWLGTRRVAYRDRRLRQFEKARAFERSLRLLSGETFAPTGGCMRKARSLKISQQAPTLPMLTRAGLGGGIGSVPKGSQIVVGNSAESTGANWRSRSSNPSSHKVRSHLCQRVAVQVRRSFPKVALQTAPKRDIPVRNQLCGSGEFTGTEAQ